MKTGFNAAEIFRKYLWYLLRERKFDPEAVNDVVQLKSSLQLSDEEVSTWPSSSVHQYLLAHIVQRGPACEQVTKLPPACLGPQPENMQIRCMLVSGYPAQT